MSYRWWTVRVWAGRNVPSYEDGSFGVKFGPLTVFGYRWFDARWRVSWTWLCGQEHIVFGGPLAISAETVDTDGQSS